MINASEFKNSKFLESNLVKIFPIEASKSQLSLVRIATSFREIDIAIKIGITDKSQVLT